MRVREWSKGILGSVIGGIGVGYIWFFYYTTRWKRVGQEHLDGMLAQGGGVACAWHARLFPIAMLRPRGRRALAMVSSNRDGEIIARILAGAGIGAIRGSSHDPRKPRVDRGGSSALQRALKEVRDGAIVTVTPDGPRGPLMRAKPGAAWVAIAAQAPVMPIAFAVRRAKIFNSWDQFILPWPFNRGVLVFGAPLYPPTSLDDAALEAFRAEIEAALYAATLEADRLVGRETPQQGPPLAAPPAQKNASPADDDRIDVAASPEADA